MGEIELVEGDTLPVMSGFITKDDGKPEDITGWTITLHIGYSTPKVIEATIPVGTDGFYQFDWAPGDLIAGLYKAEVQVQSPAGIQTFQKTKSGDQIMLNIAKQIA